MARHVRIIVLAVLSLLASCTCERARQLSSVQIARFYCNVVCRSRSCDFVRHTDARCAAVAAQRKIAATAAAHQKHAPAPGLEATSGSSQLSSRSSVLSLSLLTHASSNQHQARGKKLRILGKTPNGQGKLPPSKAAARLHSIVQAMQGVTATRAHARGKKPRVLGKNLHVLGKMPQIKAAARDEPRNARRDDGVRVCTCVRGVFPRAFARVAREGIRGTRTHICVHTHTYITSRCVF